MAVVVEKDPLRRYMASKAGDALETKILRS
jgi:hypothetical protein